MFSRRRLLTALGWSNLLGPAAASASQRDVSTDIAQAATSGGGPALTRQSETPEAQDSSVAAIANLFSLKRYAGKADMALVAGYFAPGDGGGGAFFWKNGDITPEDGGMAIASDSRGTQGRWRRADVAGAVNVRWFGARGDGKSDDSMAFTQALAAALSRGQDAAVAVPAGVYVLRARGLRQQGGNVNWIGQPGASVVLDANAYFLTCDGYIGSTHVANLGFRGGKGAFRYTNTDKNVSGNHVFTDCEFLNYTECAIGNNSADQPYLKVSRCIFKSAPNARAIGVAWGGNLDRLSIANCAFLLNAYHLKIGPRLSGDASITDNDFISFAAGVRVADIWIVPNTASVNAGVGLVISRNKFGNENMKPDNIRMLIANEEDAPNADRLTRRHATQWADAKAFVEGVLITENRISGVSGSSAPFLRSHVGAVSRFIIRDNLFDGGSYQRFIEFADAEGAARSNYATNNWLVDLAPAPPGVPAFPLGFANRPLTIGAPSRANGSLAESELLHPSGGDDAGFLPLATMTNPANVATADGRLVDFEHDAHFRFDTAKGSISLPLASVVAGRMAWIELVAKAAPEFGPQIVFKVTHPASGAVATVHFGAIGPAWTTLRAPFMFPDTAPANGWTLQLMSGGLISAQGGDVFIRHLHVYHSRQAMNAGSLRTLGNGRWDGGHMILGQYHLWVDDAGKLRMAGAAPTSDRDGRPIGG
jgi:hypothetical protein